MNKLFIISLIVLCFFISGCQSTNIYATEKHQEPKSLLKDELFPTQQHVVVESPEEIFALNDDIRSNIRKTILTERDLQARAERLIKFIFGAESTNLAYQNHATMIAQDAFDQKTANCISLTILAYSLADFAGLEAEFQDVNVPEYWVRNGAYNMLSGHVNLVITKGRTPSSIVLLSRSGVEIDFDPFIQKQNFSKKKISKETVTAMFYNNKGANAIVEREYAKAYRYFKEAILIDPGYAGTWANLGILYRFNDHNVLAEQSYRHAISMDPKSLNTLTNLSILLEMQGDFDESRKIDSAIIKHRINNPYYHALLADEAMYDGMHSKAIRHYKRAIKLDARIHELHFGIAKAYLAKGDFLNAKSSMKKAIKANKVSSIDDKYIAKLNILKRRD